MILLLICNILQFMWKRHFYLHGTYSRKFYVYFRLALVDSVAHLLFFYICCWCYPPADVFAIKVFNCHHKNWLTYSDGTDRFGELCYSFSISNKLSETIIWHSCWLRRSLWSITVRDNPWDNIFKLGALMLFPNFVSASRLELICISLIVNISSSLIH